MPYFVTALVNRCALDLIQAIFCAAQAKFGLDPTDVLMVVRGFAQEEHRLEETIKAIRNISEWREKVRAAHFVWMTQLLVVELYLSGWLL